MSVKKQNFASSVELAGIQVHAAPPRGVYCLYTSTRGGAARISIDFGSEARTSVEVVRRIVRWTTIVLGFLE